MDANHQYVFTSPSALLALGKSEGTNDSNAIINSNENTHSNDNGTCVNYWNALYESLEQWSFSDKDNAILNENKNSSSSSTQSTSPATPFNMSSTQLQVLSPLQTPMINSIPPQNPNFAQLLKESLINSSSMSLDTTTGQPKISFHANQLPYHVVPLPPQLTLPISIQAVLLFGGSAKYEVQTGACSWLLLAKDTNMLIGQGAIPTRKPYPSIIQAKCEGLLYGLQNAIGHNIHTINIKSSSEVVLQLISIRTIQLCPNRYLKTIYHYAENLFKSIQAHIDKFDRIVLELVPATHTKEVYQLAFEIMKNHLMQFSSAMQPCKIIPPPLIIEDPHLPYNNNCTANRANDACCSNDDSCHFKCRLQIEHDFNTVPGVHYSHVQTNFDLEVNPSLTRTLPIESPQIISPSQSQSNAKARKQDAFSSSYPYKCTHQQQTQLTQRRASAPSTNKTHPMQLVLDTSPFSLSVRYNNGVPVDTSLYSNRLDQQLPLSRPVSPFYDEIDCTPELSPFPPVHTPAPQTQFRTATRTRPYTPARTPTYTPPHTFRSPGLQCELWQDGHDHGQGQGLSQIHRQMNESVIHSAQNVSAINKHSNDFYSAVLTDENCHGRELGTAYPAPFSPLYSHNDSQTLNYYLNQSTLNDYPWSRSVGEGMDTPTTVAANLTPDMTRSKPHFRDNELHCRHVN